MRTDSTENPRLETDGQVRPLGRTRAARPKCLDRILRPTVHRSRPFHLQTLRPNRRNDASRPPIGTLYGKLRHCIGLARLLAGLTGSTRWLVGRKGPRPCATILLTCTELASDDYLRAFSGIPRPCRIPEGRAQLRSPRRWPKPKPRQSFAPRAREGGGRTSAGSRWGFPRGTAEGRPGHQFPLRGAALPERALPVIPASHFFEFTRTKWPESKWKFTKTGEDWFCFAGLWRPMPDGAGEAFTLLTTEHRTDVDTIHDRRMVVLDRPGLARVARFTMPESELLRPLPGPRLTVEQVGWRRWQP